MADFYGIPDYILFLIVTLFVLYLYLTRNFDYWKNRGIPEVPPTIITGSVGLDIKTNQSKREQEWYKKYGKLFGIYEGSQPALMIAEPELIKDILVKDFHAFSDQRLLRFGDPIMDRVLMAQTGEKWKELRSIMSPTFTSGKMRVMSKLTNYCTQTLTDNFIEAAKANKEIDVYKYFGAFTMDVIAKCAFGVNLDSRKDPNNPFVTAAKESIGSVPWRFIVASLFPGLAKLIRLSFFNPKTTAFFKKVVLEVIKNRENMKDEDKPMDFLRLLMDAKEKENEVNENENKKLDLDDVIAQCIVFFIGGYFGIAGTLTFAAHQLAVRSEIQEKLFNDIDQVLKNEEELDYDSVANMKYLDAFLEEVLRYYTPGIRLERKAVEDYELGNTGIVIEKDTVVIVPAYAIHHDPIYFPDPYRFDPDRFTSEGRKSIIPYTSLSFGIGPRNCIGMRFAQMEIKMALAKILQHIRFVPGSKTKPELELVQGMGFNRPRNVILKTELRK